MSETSSVYVLDTFAVMAHFQSESGGEKVLELLEQGERGEIFLAMSLINVGEMVYVVRCEKGRTKAESMLDDLYSLPIKFYEATKERILAAAWLKSEYSISYADVFAASLAQELNAPLVTGHPEFKAIKQNLSLLWLE